VWIVTPFSNIDGSPATGLTPQIYIEDIESSSVVSGSMTERNHGFYIYDFTGYDSTKSYMVFCDAVTLPTSIRYSHSSSGEYGDKINDIDVRTLLIKKIHTNKLELQDGDTGNWVLYQDDGINPLLIFNVTDKDGTFITQSPHTPSKRSKAIE